MGLFSRYGRGEPALARQTLKVPNEPDESYNLARQKAYADVMGMTGV